MAGRIVPSPVPPSEINDSDRVLVERAKSDPEAFGRLFDRYFDPIFAYLFRRTGDWEASRDLASETFLKALKALPRYRWQGRPLSAWLFAIATNELRMYYRRGQRAPASLDALIAESGVSVPDPSTLDQERQAAEHELERSEEFVRVRKALTALPLKYQEAIALRYFEEKSVAEVAEILGKPEGTVKSLLSRGLERLRRTLDQTQPY